MKKNVCHISITIEVEKKKTFTCIKESVKGFIIWIINHLSPGAHALIQNVIEQ